MLENVMDYLPIGTVVLLKSSTRKLMIFGIIQMSPKRKGHYYDYIGVPYPEGNTGIESQVFFDDDDITEIFFEGYMDKIRDHFLESLKNLQEKEQRQHNTGFRKIIKGFFK